MLVIAILHTRKYCTHTPLALLRRGYLLVHLLDKLTFRRIQPLGGAGA